MKAGASGRAARLSASRAPVTWLLPLCRLNSLGAVPVGEEAGDAQCLNPEPAQLPGSIYLRSFQACPLTCPRQLGWGRHVIYSSCLGRGDPFPCLTFCRGDSARDS